MFANFIEVQFLGGSEKQELIYFSKLMTQERTKANPMVIKPFKPAKVTRTYPPNSQGIPSSSKPGHNIETYQYKVFPKLNPREFVASRLTDVFVEEDANITLRKEDEVRQLQTSRRGRLQACPTRS